LSDIATNTTDTSAPPPPSSDAPDVFSHINSPIEGATDEQAVRAATAEQRKRREQEAEAAWSRGEISDDAFAEQRAPVIERRYDGRDKSTKTLKEASHDLTEGKKWERADVQSAIRDFGGDAEQVGRLARDVEFAQRMGLTPVEAEEWVRSGTLPPTKVGLVADYWGKDGSGKVFRPPLQDHDKILGRPEHEALTPRDAAREVKAFREAAAAQQQALLESLSAQEFQAETGPAVGQTVPIDQGPAEQTQVGAAGQTPADPVTQLQNQLAQERQVFHELQKLSDEERRAANEIKKWGDHFSKQFPEASSQAAIEELRLRNPARFAAMQQEAAKAQRGVASWMHYGAVHTNERQTRERAIDEYRNAQVRAAWHQYRQAEDEKFHHFAPEMNDPVKASTTRVGVKAMLKEIGFGDEELARAWDGQTGFSVRDHRAQRLILDAFRWRQAQANQKAIASKRAPIPPVQRPGTVRPRGADNQADIQRLQRELDSATGERAVRLATRLHQLQRQAG
jgi:hypothetical protein